VWQVVATWEEVPSKPAADGGPPFSRWVERCALSISRAVPDDAGPALLLATVVAGAGVVAGIDSGRRPSSSQRLLPHAATRGRSRRDQVT
jgi:hypothetical protein